MRTLSARKAIVSFGRRHLHWIVIAVAAGVLRLWRIEHFPVLFGDEDIYLHLSQGFLQGRHTMFAIHYAYIPHPPFFFFLGGIFTALFGSTYITLRTLCVLAGILSCIGLYFVGKQVGGRRLGFIAAAMLTVMPQAVFHTRLAYGYSIVALFTVLFALVLVIYETRVEISARKWLGLLLGVIAGLASITEFSGGTLVLFSLGYFVWKHRKDIWLVLPGAVGIPAFSYGYFFLRTPSWFLADLQINSGRGGTAFIVLVLFVGTFWAIPLIRNTLRHIFRQALVIVPMLLPLLLAIAAMIPITEDQINTSTSLFWIGLFGLMLMKKSVIRTAILGETLALLSYQLLTDRSDRTLLPLYPFLALGMALLIVRSLELWRIALSRVCLQRSVWTAASVVSVTGMISIYLVQTVSVLTPPSISVGDPAAQEIEALASYIQTHSFSTDLVVAEPVLTMVPNEKKATLQQVVSHGQTIEYHYAIGESYVPGRYLYPADVTDARLICIDEVFLKVIRKDADMSVHFRTTTIPARAWELDLFRTRLATVLSWPSVTIGRATVFENPNLSPL